MCGPNIRPKIGRKHTFAGYILGLYLVTSAAEPANSVNAPGHLLH